MKKSKPTRNEIKTVLNNLLIEVSQMSSFLQGLDTSFAAYLDMKGDGDKLNKYIKAKIKEANNEQSK